MEGAAVDDGNGPAVDGNGPAVVEGNSKAVAKHYNSLREGGRAERSESRIFFMRNFNNWIKSMLIQETADRIQKSFPGSGLNVLDLCSGKGGDLLKWSKANISKLTCADIAETSVRQCEDRYRSHRGRHYEAEFIQADLTRDDLHSKFKDKSQKFHVTSCQFSFHYCFESFNQAQVMLKNATECLLPGGYFIGTTANAYELVKRLRKAPEFSFGNEIYKAQFEIEDKDNLPLFGCKYMFKLEGVVDCPEYLVYQPLFIRLAQEHGLELVKIRTFHEYFEENKESGRDLMLRMKSLEMYDLSKKDQRLMGTKPDSYEHMKDVECSGYKTRYGTLSKEEWEAASFYLVFIFQKLSKPAKPSN